jgi:predicted ATPase
MPVSHPELTRAETLVGPWPGGDASESPTLALGAPGPSLRLEAGIVLNGRYRVEEFVGRGGMGEVFRVSDALHPDRKVALKTVRAVSLTAARLDWFKAEFNTMTSLRHPNVAAAYDFEPVQGTSDFVFTMEYVEGQDAFQACEGAPWTTVVDYLIQVCRALSYLHTRKLIHFDVKPSNLMVDGQGRVKLLDFGLSSARHAAGQLRHRGTPQYMAPELARSDAPLDHRVDLYALGITAYVLLCRRPPFDATNMLEMLRLHAFQPLAFDATDSERIPHWLRAIVERLCAKEAAGRYRTANDVIADVNRQGNLSYELETRETRESYVLAGRFVGRDAQLSRLDEAVAERTGGRGGRPLVLVHGQSGAGKSTLLREVRYHTQLSGVCYCEGACHEGSFADFAPVAAVVAYLVRLAEATGATGLLQDFGPDLAKIHPPLARERGILPSPTLPDPDGERRRLREQLTGFFVGLADVIPYVVAIEDLHWARSGLTEALAHLANAIAIRERTGRPVRLMLLGSFREDEVDGRPVARLLADPALDSCGERIGLTPLDQPQVGLVLASMLGVDCLPEAFVARVWEETGGSPFFVEEVMRTLLEIGVVALEDGAWSARSSIGEIPIPSSVATVLRRRTALLDAAPRGLMELLAVAGRPISTDVLAAASGLAPDAFHAALSALTRNRMVATRQGPEPLHRVAHARMVETVRSDLNPQQLPALHRRLAVTIETVHADRLEEHVYELADHFNAALPSLSDPAERTKVARLNLSAATAARAAAAFDAARAYSAAALDLLPEETWTTDYDLMAGTVKRLAEAECVTERFDDAERHYRLLAARAHTHLERVDLAVERCTNNTAMGRLSEGLDAAFEGLAELGFHYPRRPGMRHVAPLMLRARILRRWKSAEALCQMPDIEDPERKALLALLSAAIAPAFMSHDEPMLVFLNLKGLLFTARWGSTPESSYFYASHAFILEHVLGDFRGGEWFGGIAQRLSERHSAGFLAGPADFLLAAFVLPWQLPLRTTAALQLRIHEGCLRTGNMLFAGFSLNVAITQTLLFAESIETFLRFMDEHEGFLLRLNNPHTIAELVALRQMLKVFTGETVSPETFDSEGFRQADFERFLFNLDDKIPVGFYFAFRLRALVIMGLHRQALDLVAESDRRVLGARGQAVFADHILYSFLALAWAWPEAPAGERRRLRRALKKKLAQMEEFAGMGPENFRHEALHLRAEMAHLEGRDADARRLYDESIACARRDGFPLNAALATEWSARFLLERGRTDEGRARLRDAQAAYLAWGARAKANALDAELGEAPLQPPPLPAGA